LEFKNLPIQTPLIDNLQKVGFKSLTPIQEKSIPVILSGQDLFGQAATGTGKTGAYLIPLISRVLATQARGAQGILASAQEVPSNSSSLEATNQNTASQKANEPVPFLSWHGKSLILVVLPTRELCDQVAESFNKFAAGFNLGGAVIYGGVGYEDQVRALKARNCHFIFATPGRLIDLYKEHEIDFKQVKSIVFDEADRLFDMGFRDDIKFILNRIPRDRQLLVFSATLNFEVQETCYQFGAAPVEVALDREKVKPPKLHDFLIHVSLEDKSKYMFSILKKYNPESAIVFTNYKNQVEALAEFLTRNGFSALGISSLLSQQQRNRVMHQFKNEKRIKVLVATDVGSRGLDIHGVDLVLNFELPQDSESYVHRIGRTARSGASGTAISLVSHEDIESMERIHKYLGQKIEGLWLDDSEIFQPEVSWEQFRRKIFSPQVEGSGRFLKRGLRGKGPNSKATQSQQRPDQSDLRSRPGRRNDLRSGPPTDSRSDRRAEGSNGHRGGGSGYRAEARDRKRAHPRNRSVSRASRSGQRENSQAGSSVQSTSRKSSRISGSSASAKIPPPSWFQRAVSKIRRLFS
jgi:ATP-dependent RNA helicase RhlB